MLTVTTEGLDELERDLDEAATRAQSQPEVWRKAGTLLVAGIRRRAPYRTGRLRRSVGADVEPAGLEVGPDLSQAPYAGVVEQRHPYIEPTGRELDQVEDLLADYVVAPLERP